MSGYNNAIGWCDVTWNPIRGCSRVSEGCRFCYAERTAIRMSQGTGAYRGLVKSTPNGPRWTGEIRFVEDALTLPLSWKKPRRVFVNSMSDLFHEKLTDEQIGRVFETMAVAAQHVYQVLTKRADRMRDFMQKYSAPGGPLAKPLPNVWLGVSVEDQAAADKRIPLLLQTRAAVRFLSVEPLLGPVDVADWLEGFQPLNADLSRRPSPIHWVIVGGESGPGARACDLAWIRSIVAQCRAAGVPCFVKQLGSRPVYYDGGTNPLCTLRLADRKGGDMAEWPEDLRVREFPASPRVAVQEGDSAP